MANKQYTTTELAKALGISRVAVFNKIKKGHIKAKKIGNRWIIDPKEVEMLLQFGITLKRKKEIDTVIDRAVKEYREAFELLADT